MGAFFTYLLFLCAMGAIGFLLGGRLAARGRTAQLLTLFGALALFAVNQWLQVLPVLETTLFPWPDYIYLHNWALPCVGLFSGAALGHRQRPTVQDRRIFLVLALLVFAFFHTFTDLLPDVPFSSTSVCREFICEQTDESTCAPAAVAAYIGLMGGQVSEREAAEMALTRAEVGTSPFGIWRSLALLAERTGRDDLRARVRALDLESMLELDRPAVIRVELRKNVGPNLYARLRETWVPGLSHAVLFLGRYGPFVQVADPGSGRVEVWDLPQFAALWDGYVFVLEDGNGPLPIPPSVEVPPVRIP